jgi:protein-S-isoprenylcysteine O-methyltransferase Ste14
MEGSEADVHRALVRGVLLASVAVFCALQFVTAPYGRHGRGGWGPTTSARTGWIVMESPSVVVFAAVFAAGDPPHLAAPASLAALWLVHYVHRAFVFPLRVARSAHRMPWTIVGSGLCFNAVNSYLNARWISHFGRYPPDWFADPRFGLGVALFVVGLLVNLHSDAVLLNLRAPGDATYRVPRGGLFQWVSSPNYLGELLEWTGWALATWSVAGASFAVFTAANLVPRARNHHRWYRATFADYPRERRALVPYVW